MSHSNLNVKPLIVFKKFYKIHDVGAMTLVNKKNSTSLILTNLRVEFDLLRST
jgi:hypothetical protein